MWIYKSENGRVFLKVKNEFEVALTVLGEDLQLTTEVEQSKKYPWVVLGIELFISSSGAMPLLFCASNVSRLM